MIFISGQAIYFDCDETLVLWGRQNHPEAVQFDCYDLKQKLIPHFEHIEELKAHKAKGNTVVVWSAGGANWALEVVKTLELEPYVDLVVAKPSLFYDDLSAHEFLPEFYRIYKPFKDDWERG